MAIVIGIIVGVGSLAGLGIAGKIGASITPLGFEYLRRKKKKKQLKEKLSRSIDRINYTDFVDVIYEIKGYDTKYGKSLFIKITLHLNF